MPLSVDEEQQGKGKTPMSNLVPFQFEQTSISVITDDEHNPWWVASEICAVLGIKDVSDACERLDEDEKQLISLNDARISTPTVHPELKMLIVNEPGLYGLVLGSWKKAAKEFKRWITHEVLPQIRKTGQYTASLPQVKNPAHQLMIDTVVRIDVMEQELQQHQAQLMTQQQAMIAFQAQQIEALQRSEQAEATADRAETKADSAVQNQNFWTVAEYVQYHENLRRQCPESAYTEASRHMQAYCKRERLNFRDPNILPRRIPVGDKNWETEWGFHVSVYEAAFLPWLLRRNSQTHLGWHEAS